MPCDTWDPLPEIKIQADKKCKTNSVWGRKKEIKKKRNT